MASAQNLNNYLDSLQYLSFDLQRNSNLLRELDEKAMILMQRIDAKTEKLMIQILTDSVVDEALVEDIRRNFKLVNKYVEYKLELAKQSYELTNKYIRRLDNNIEKFRFDIQKTFTERNVPITPELLLEGVPANDFNEKLWTELSNTKEVIEENKIIMVEKNSKNCEESAGEMITKDNKEQEADISDSIDPNEPIFCICRQIAFGEMIACDNGNCEIEWFHFPCVNLVANPMGEWWCPTCKSDKITRGKSFYYLLRLK